MTVRKLFVLLIAVFLLSGFAETIAQQPKNTPIKSELIKRLESRYNSMRGPTWQRLRTIKSGPMAAVNDREGRELIGVDAYGRLRIYKTENLTAAQTIGVDETWPGGSTGLNLSGAETVSGEMSIWDGGGVRTSHVEFEGRAEQMDVPGGYSSHSTHVAGTMSAAGIDPDAKGMSFEAAITCYEWNNDSGEMASSAANNGLKVSNHSYGYVTGFDYDYDNGSWYWYGDPTVSETEDFGFGYYGNDARGWDEIAYENPYYLIFKSAGNDRGEGPDPGTGHYVFQGGQWTWSTVEREVDGGPDGYDCVSWNGTAKNIVAVGAINDITGGYDDPNDVVMTSFSGWGPTDDGRIKPDISANGTGLYSTTSYSDQSYSISSGTSMASPNMAGAANLLVQHYKSTHNGEPMRAATLKALILHTADEAGDNDGPDYRFGWGLANTWRAAELISTDANDLISIQEAVLDDGLNHNYFYDVLEDGPVRITICWTDPEGDTPPRVVNPTDPILVNDLDVRLINLDTEEEYMPWVLDPESPADAATTGDNFRDNVEQVYVADAPAGSYRIDISHEETLEDGEQAYSMILSGLIWADDPRVPPESLSADLDETSGEVVLTWEFDDGLDEFIEFLIYRDGVQIGTTTELTYSDTLDDFGTVIYEVSSLYDEGESRRSNAFEITWLEPVAPINLRLVNLDQESGDVTIAWDHYRSQLLQYDDGTVEQSYTYSSAAPEGAMFAHRMTSPGDGVLLEVGAWFSHSIDYPFGQVQFKVYGAGEDESAPGDLLYESEIFVPEEDGWLWHPLPEYPELTDEGDFWVAIAWIDRDATRIGRDTDGPFYERGVYSPNGAVWFPLVNALQGNPLIRAQFGVPEQIEANNDLDALQYYTVLRDNAEVGEETGWMFSETLPTYESYTYTVRAQYEQGHRTSDPLVVNWSENSVAGDAQLPRKYKIGTAFPNPFNPSVTLEVSLPEVADVNLSVFDLLGREVSRIHRNSLAAGNHRLTWQPNQGTSAGIYFLRVDAGTATRTQKIVFMK